MKNKLICYVFISVFLFTGCDLLFNKIADDVNDAINEKFDGTVDFTVWGFSEDSVVLSWSTDKPNVRYKIYVKNKNGVISCVEGNYGKTNYFISSDNQSSYRIGILLNDEEVYKTEFKYPSLENGTGFPVHGEISDDSYIGVEFLYPSNVDEFNLNIKKEGEDKIIPTKKYPATEMNDYLFPLRYNENSHNNQFIIIFTIDDTEYKSAPYYFDYDAHLEATEDGFVTFYPSL